MAPPSLVAADTVEVQVLVDNVTDNLSTLPKGVTHEWAQLIRRGLVTEIAGERICCACHGLSLVITAKAGGREHTVLFDGGPEAYAVIRNGARLAVDFGRIEAVVLSHGHWDHAGGLLAALDLIRKANGGTEVPFYVHPDMFRQRGVQRPGALLVPYKPIPDPLALIKGGAGVIATAEPQLFLDGLFYVSGEIPRTTPYETGYAGHVRRTEDGTDWEPDPWLMDERFLAVNVKGKGVLVFTACSHAGVVNVLKHAAEVFQGTRLHAVMGGFHLAGPGMEERIAATVGDMAGFGLEMIVPGHCTGWRAVTRLVNAFGEDVVVPSAVGRFHVF